VLTQIINEKVGTKVGIRIDKVVGKIGEVKIIEMGRLTMIGMCIPKIVHNQNT